MLEPLPLAHTLVPPQPGYPELASVTLARECERFDRNAELRREMAVFPKLARVGFTAFILALGFLAAANWGLSRTERAYQEASRV